MRFSVVINTYNRAKSLAVTLDALKYQTHDDFEVVVVNGPSTDHTAELLAARPEVRAVDCAERHLAVSRNIGIDAAAGDVVAFIDDDAVPEPRWLADLERSYGDARVGGVGGLVLDGTGTKPQFRYSVCSRVGETDFDRHPPFDVYNTPGADPYMYLQGTNCSFRRDVLEHVGGFDEEIEYNYDESELCGRIIDAGWRLETRDDGAVHHKVLPSHMRGKNVHDPFIPIKNRTYFAVRVGREAGRPMADIVSSLGVYISGLRAGAHAAVALGEATDAEAEFYLRRLDEGFELGFERGLEGRRKGRSIASRPDSSFRPYPTIRSEGRRLTVCFITLDHPPRPVGGISRFTAELAQGFAAAGHEAHVVTRDDDRPYHIEFEHGVWVHRFPVKQRWIPTLDAQVSRGNLEHLAAVHNAVSRITDRASIDVVAGSLWAAEPLFCAYDPRWVTTVFCNTPMRKVAETHPHTAGQPHVEGQIRLEDETLRSGAHLQPVSHTNADLVRSVDGVPGTGGMTVTWHGLKDRHGEFERRRHDDAVEILFVGRLEPRKGVDVLLEAAVEVLRERPNARLRLIGGDNPEANGGEEHFQRWTVEHGADVASRVTFEGQVDDDALYQALADADIFCAPSRYESFGLVHIEAMMMSVPVVASRAGGMQETVVDGETGLLVPPGDARGLADALRRLVDEPDLRDAMGKAGRVRFEGHFDLTVAVRDSETLYRSLVDGRTVVDTNDARRTLLERTADLLERQFGLSAVDAADTAEVLLDPRAFPVDHQAVARWGLEQPDDVFLRELYSVVLNRLPDTEGFEDYRRRMAMGMTRVDVIAEVASAPEAAGGHFDATFLSYLPRIEWSELVETLRTTWLEADDEVFVRLLHRTILGDVDERTVRQEVDQLASGTPRSDVLRHVANRIAAHRRVLNPLQLTEARLRTREDLIGGVERAVALADDEACVRALYRALFEREADDGGLAAYATLAREEGRARVVLELASAGEARGLGIPPSFVPTLVAAAAAVTPPEPTPVPAPTAEQASEPPAPPESPTSTAQPARASRGIARRVLAVARRRLLR